MENSVYINDEKQDVLISPIYSGGCLFVWNMVDINGQQINQKGPHFRLNLSQDNFLKFFKPTGAINSLHVEQGLYLGQVDETAGRLAADGIGLERYIRSISFQTTIENDTIISEIEGETLGQEDYSNEHHKRNSTQQAFRIKFSYTKSNIDEFFLGDEQTKQKYLEQLHA